MDKVNCFPCLFSQYHVTFMLQFHPIPCLTLFCFWALEILTCWVWPSTLKRPIKQTGLIKLKGENEDLFNVATLGEKQMIQ